MSLIILFVSQSLFEIVGYAGMFFLIGTVGVIGVSIIINLSNLNII